MKRLFAVAVATLGALAVATPAAAMGFLCDDDPPISVETPAGNHLTINNYLVVSASERHLLKLATFTGTTVHDPAGGTFVRIRVTLPNGSNAPVHITSVSQRYETFNSADARWGGGAEIVLHVPLD